MADKRKLFEGVKTKLADIGDRASQQEAAHEVLAGPEGRPIMIPCDRIQPGSHQPRTYFEDESLQQLAQTIKERGLLQPIIVRQDGDTFSIIAGERRWRASQLAGLKEIPAILKQEGDPLALALIENIQREDLNAKDLAHGLKALKGQHKYTDEQLAAVLGKSRSRVTEILALNQLPNRVFQEMSDVRHSLDTILQVARQPSIGAMITFWNRIKQSGAKTVRDVRSLNSKPSKGRPSGYVFHRRGQDYSLTLRFSKSKVQKKEISNALKETLGAVEKGEE